MKIEYITSNAQKFEEASHILDGFELERISLELTEVQGSKEEVTAHKAREALKILQRPLVVEDVSFCLSALNGLPGPYIKDFLITLGEQGIYELAHKYSDRSAKVVCIAAFIKPGTAPVLFEGVLEGDVVAPKGNTKHGKHSWNTIFQPRGYKKTFGEMSIKELSQISMRNKALTKLKAYLESNEK